MPNWDSRNRSAMNSAEIAAAYLDDREDELLDAVGTAPALVGAAESVERCELLIFDRHELLCTMSRYSTGSDATNPATERRCRNTPAAIPQRGIARTGSRD